MAHLSRIRESSHLSQSFWILMLLSISGRRQGVVNYFGFPNANSGVPRGMFPISNAKSSPETEKIEEKANNKQGIHIINSAAEPIGTASHNFQIYSMVVPQKNLGCASECECVDAESQLHLQITAYNFPFTSIYTLDVLRRRIDSDSYIHDDVESSKKQTELDV